MATNGGSSSGADEVAVTWTTVATRIDATVVAVLLVVALCVPWLIGEGGQVVGVSHRHALGGSAVQITGVLLVGLLLATGARAWALLEVASAALGVAVALLAQQVRFDPAYDWDVSYQAVGTDTAVTAVLLVYAARVAMRCLRQASVPGRFRWTD